MPRRANSLVPRLSGPYSKSVVKTSSGPIRLTAPPPKSPTVSGNPNVAKWATANDCSSPELARLKIRPSKPPGRPASMPWAVRPGTSADPAHVAGHGHPGIGGSVEVLQRPRVETGVAGKDAGLHEFAIVGRLPGRSVESHVTPSPGHEVQGGGVHLRPPDQFGDLAEVVGHTLADAAAARAVDQDDERGARHLVVGPGVARHDHRKTGRRLD